MDNKEYIENTTDKEKVNKRVCNKCKVEKTLTSESFYRDSSRACGFEFSCKECEKTRRKERYKRVSEREKEKSPKNRKCSKCGLDKDLNLKSFYRQKDDKHGFTSQCKECISELQKSTYVKSDKGQWTEEEKEILRKYYPILDNKEIHNSYLPHRTLQSIVDYARKTLDIKKSEDYVMGWSEDQLDYLKENYGDNNIHITEISQSIGKSADTIRARASKMGLKRGRVSIWTVEEKETIKKFYPYMKTLEFREKFMPDKSEIQIVSCAQRLGISKDKDFFKKVQLETALKNLEKVDITDLKRVVRVEVPCTTCSKIMVKIESELNESGNHFCNYACMGEWMSNNLKGKNNPNYGNGKAWTADMRKASAKRAVSRLLNSDFKLETTNPERITDNILDRLKEKTEPEYDCKYYLVDRYLTNHHLMIEVQGNYFHCNPTMSSENTRKSAILRKDTAKNTYIKRYHGVDVLYLWEKDLIENEEMCELLTKTYIEKRGKLENYHSFNYEIINGELRMKKKITGFNY